MACASFLFLTIIKRMPSFLEHPFYNMENTFWNDNPYPMLFYYWARIGVMTIPSAPIPVFLFTISSIWARWASVNSAALIITSTVSSVGVAKPFCRQQYFCCCFSFCNICHCHHAVNCCCFLLLCNTSIVNNF